MYRDRDGRKADIRGSHYLLKIDLTPLKCDKEMRLLVSHDTKVVELDETGTPRSLPNRAATEYHRKTDTRKMGRSFVVGFRKKL